eukprot:1159625-Pelagomonas_calceolata.AAC.6
MPLCCTPGSTSCQHLKGSVGSMSGGCHTSNVGRLLKSKVRSHEPGGVRGQSQEFVGRGAAGGAVALVSGNSIYWTHAKSSRPHRFPHCHGSQIAMGQQFAHLDTWLARCNTVKCLTLLNEPEPGIASRKYSACCAATHVDSRESLPNGFKVSTANPDSHANFHSPASLFSACAIPANPDSNANVCSAAGLFSACAMPATSAMAARWVPPQVKASTLATVYMLFNMGECLLGSGHIFHEPHLRRPQDGCPCKRRPRTLQEFVCTSI